MKNILSNTPTSYAAIKFETYLKTLSIQTQPEGLDQLEEYSFNMDRSVQLLAILTDNKVEEIEALQATKVTEALNKLKFMETEMPKVKIKHKAKAVKDITYSNFVDYINLTRSNKAIENLPIILSLFFYDLTEAEVKQMPTDYVFSCFFLLKKQQRKYWRGSLFKTILQTFKHLIREAIWKLKNKVQSIF